MEKYKDLAEYALEKLKRSGAEDASCYISRETRTEANYEQGEFALLRTYDVNRIYIKSVSGHKAGTAAAALLSREAIDEAAEQCISKMRLAEADPYEGIAKNNLRKSFSKGSLQPDADGMLRSIRNCIDEKASNPDEDPITHYTFTHHHKDEVCLNTSGLDLSSRLGYYFAGDQSTNAYLPDLSRPLAELGQVETPYKESIRKQTPISLGSKFEGTMIFTPRYLRLYWWLSHLIVLSPEATSGDKRHAKHLWADRFGQQVAPACFTLSNRPMDARVYNASPFTHEGHLARNTDIVKDGILTELLYPDRIARMLGRTPNIAPREESDGELNLNIFIKPGEESIHSMIKGIDKGVLLFTMRGSIPYENPGDFSGLANEALLIENGQIVGLTKGVTVRGNFYEMQKNIRGVSKEYRLTGGDLTPWIAYDGLTIEQ